MMASSTTIPIASTKPNMVSVLMVKPNGMKKQKVDKILNPLSQKYADAKDEVSSASQIGLMEV